MPNMSEVKVGDVLPELRKAIELPTLVTYAAATWDFHRYHYDPEFAQARNMPAPIADGQMFGAYFAQFLLDWAGRNALLRKLSIRYRSLVHPGDEVTCWGSVTDVEPGNRTVTIEGGLRARDGRDVIAPATAVIELPED